MVLEGLKFKNLASETLAHAHDNTFAKDRPISESRFTNKMCSFSVQNDKICSVQRSFLVNIFGYDTCIRTISKQNMWLLVSFYRHKNIISRRVHTMITQHAPNFTKLNKIILFTIKKH